MNIYKVKAICTGRGKYGIEQSDPFFDLPILYPLGLPREAARMIVGLTNKHGAGKFDPVRWTSAPAALAIDIGCDLYV